MSTSNIYIDFPIFHPTKKRITTRPTPELPLVPLHYQSPVLEASSKFNRFTSKNCLLQNSECFARRNMRQGKENI